MARKLSSKRIAIDKANATVVIAISVAVFVVVFSLLAGKALMDQRSYQSKVIGQKKTALKQLKKNVQEVDKLSSSYQAFAQETTNILGGNPKGNGPKDGENPRIVLDALPSKYDFPALATSLDKLLRDNNYSIDSISGNDDEISQSSNQSSTDPNFVEIPFGINVSTSGTGTKSLLQLFERSIRPIQIQKLTLTGASGQELKIGIEAKTFYQPEKKFDIKVQAVKRSDNKAKSTSKTSQGSTKK